MANEMNKQHSGWRIEIKSGNKWLNAMAGRRPFTTKNEAQEVLDSFKYEDNNQYQIVPV